MLEIYFSISALIRALVYTSICISSLLVFASYRKAYYKDKPTWIIQSVMYLFLVIAFSFLFYTLASIVNLVDGAGLRYRYVVSLLGIINLPLLLAIINFWNASLNQSNCTEKNRKITYK